MQPLAGVVVCVSGLDARLKDALHAAAVKLGATFTRTLNTAINTHLILATPRGEKYETAVTK